jgi:type VI secretion system protein ImpL
MLKYIFIALFVAATWGVCIWLEFPLWIAIVVTAVAVAVVATLLIVKAVKARRASREIERALKAQAEQQAKSARPDLEADIQALQGEFNRAIQALKGSRLGAKGASSALYALPWYVIVGPPGVGKSTALRNSGLRFPFLSSRGGVSVQGVGGTRNCEWWMTSEAVILDTAGRYTTEDSDREEWFAFLDLLKKYRQRRPINGVMAAVSIADLAEAHPEEVATLAREIRARVDELQGRLGVVVPVYLVFTKCDLLPGFVEMFADLGEQERHQIWGFTLKTSDQVDLVGQFHEHYDELTAVLEKRTLRRLADERSADAREKIHQFPQYVASLREQMGRFVYELMQENIYHETPILRGVYLSSGTQEGRPINRIMSSISEAFGIQPTISTTAGPPVEAKSYFLGELFKRVIFPDYALTRPNRTRTRKRRIIGNVVGGISVAAAIGIVWLPLVSFKENREMITDGGVAMAYVEQHVAEDTVDVIPIERIEPMRAVVSQIAEYERDGAPLEMRMGMYQGRAVYPRLRDVYAATVRRELLLPTVEHEMNEMRNFVIAYRRSNKAATPEEYEANFDRLHMYLLLTSPIEAGEPGLTDPEKEWLTLVVSTLWEEPLRTTGEKATMSSIEAVAASYIEMLADRPELAFERDARLVERVREILARSDRAKTIANRLVASVTGRSLRLKDMVGTPALQNDDRVIRPAFTREGYEQQVKPRLEGNLEDLLDEQWVLGISGDQADKKSETDLGKIQTEYFRQYIDEWTTFLETIYVRGGKNKRDAKRMLDEFSPQNSPYKRLFQHISYHTQLIDFAALQAEAEGGVGENAGKRALKRVGGMVGSRAGSQLASKTGLSRLGLGGVVAQGTSSQLRSMVSSIRANPQAAEELTEAHVTLVFMGLSEFGVPPAPPPAPAGPGGAAAPPPPPEDAPLDTYLTELRSLRDALQASIATNNKDDQKKAREALRTTETRLDSLLQGNADPNWVPTVKKWLLPPLTLTDKTITEDIGVTMTNEWCNSVVTEFERTIGKGYPFNKSGQDVPLRDFAAFYQWEKGALWSYYEDGLKADIVQRGVKFEIENHGEETKAYRPQLIAFLNASYEITTAMMGREDMPTVEFDVLIKGAPEAKQILLTIDGETIKHRNGPESWATMVWPGEGAPGARVEAKGFGKVGDLEQEGEWGFFRLLEEGTVKASPGKRTFRVQWDFREEGIGLVEMEFRPKRVDTPFYGLGGRRSFMSMFRSKTLFVPQSLMAGGARCR